MKCDVPQLIEDCPICTSTSRAAIAAMRGILKASDQELSDASGFSVEQIEKHFSLHITASDTGDERLDSALDACDQLYLQALASNDLRSAAQIISTKGRLLNSTRRRKDSNTKRKDLLANLDPRNPSTWPEEWAEVFRRALDHIIERAAECEATL